MRGLFAVQAAFDALNALDLDQSQPVDPFVAIEATGLHLAFQPLRDLLGVMIPGPRPGVLINSDRPVSMQRYTAAHELGHWYMNHDAPALDTQASVLGSHGGRLETEAQIFAANFLMPPELVHATVRRYGVKRGAHVRADQAYQIARDMHVSYEAAVRHLETMRLVTTENATKLRDARPLAIKTQLSRSADLPSSRGEVWLVDEPGERNIAPMVGDLIVLQLSERPSSGYRWLLDSEVSTRHSGLEPPEPAPFVDGRAFAPDATAPHHARDSASAAKPASDVLSLLSEGRSRDSERRHRDHPLDNLEPGRAVGGTETRTLRFIADRAGDATICLRKARRADPDVAIGELRLQVHARDAPAAEFRRRLLQAFANAEAQHDPGEIS